MAYTHFIGVKNKQETKNPNKPLSSKAYPDEQRSAILSLPSLHHCHQASNRGSQLTREEVLLGTAQ